MSLLLRPSGSPPRPAFSFSVSASPAPSSPSSASEPGPGPGPSSAPRAPADFLPDREMPMFGSRPLDPHSPRSHADGDNADGTEGGAEGPRALKTCPRCGKTVMRWAMGEHRRNCDAVLDGIGLGAAKGKKVPSNGGKGSGPLHKRRASELSEFSVPSPKKRARLPSILDDEDAPLAAITSYKGMKKSEIKRLQKEQVKADKKAEKERLKREAQDRRRHRMSGPINLDERCGVPNEETGHPCARSLTCKTHTMGAKRAVLGRSRPYDELYLEWQRAHNPNFKEPAAKPTKAPGEGPAKKKGKKTWGAWDHRGADDTIPEGEEGQRELEEFIRFTKWAGERYRGLYVRYDRVQAAKEGGEGGEDGAGGGASAAGGAAAGPSGSTGAAGSGGASGKKATAGRLGPATAPGSGLMGRAMPYCPWRAAGYDMGVVGDQLTKALAMRSAGTMPLSGAGGGLKGGRGGASGAGTGGGGTTLVIPALGSRMSSAASMDVRTGVGAGADGFVPMPISIPAMATGGMFGGGEAMVAQPSFGVAA